jgi:hypothetical protein
LPIGSNNALMTAGYSIQSHQQAKCHSCELTKTVCFPSADARATKSRGQLGSVAGRHVMCNAMLLGY